jgi:hypothetical protein
MTNSPSPAVAAAAAIVQKWLDDQPPDRVTDEQFKKMDARARLDYARRFDQKQNLQNGLKRT